MECGVFKGAGFMYWLKLLKLFAHEEQRMVIGFDTFKSFADSLLEYEKEINITLEFLKTVNASHFDEFQKALE